MLDALQEAIGCCIPMPFDGVECRAFLDRVCTANDVACGIPRTTARMLDKLVGHFLEARIVQYVVGCVFLNR